MCQVCSDVQFSSTRSVVKLLFDFMQINVFPRGQKLRRPWFNFVNLNVFRSIKYLNLFNAKR